MPDHISGTVRFSVESLLYYAPKITSTGTTLASAVATVQRQLLGLGDFFGGSWPDQPFRDSYPLAQYAMLIIATQLADEIQGIGGGIEQMARTYGITENQNTADIARIQVNEGRMAALINHTGGLPQPPDTPLPLPVSQPPPLVPDPQPNTAPSPPSPAAMLTSYNSATPAPGPTPSPQPGPDPTSWHPSDMVSMLGPWPSGDPGRMEQAADCWTTLTNALDTAWSDLQRYAAYIMADAQGPAADAFNGYVDGLTATGHGSLTRAIQATQDLHDVCLNQATEVRSLRRTLEETALELAAAFVITQVVSVLTFESTQALGDALDAGIAARLTDLAVAFERVAAMLGKKLDDVVAATSKVVSASLAAGFQSAAIAGADIEANDWIGRAFGQPPTPATTALLDVLKAGGLGIILGQGSAGGLLGESAGAASTKLIALGEVLKNGENQDSGVATALIGLGRQLKSGAITVSAANAALTQLVTQHELSPVTFFSSAIANRFTTAISPSTGKHAAG